MVKNIKISKLIKKNKIYKSPEQLIEFIKTSIENREYAKFIFSKSIDLIFKNLRDFGRKSNITRDDLSFLKINYFLEAYFNLSLESFTIKLKEKNFFK